MRRAFFAAVFLTFLCAGQVMARDLSQFQNLLQSEFREFSNQAGTAFAYRNTATPVPLGFPGFELGALASFSDTDSALLDAYWKLAFGESAPSMLPVPVITARLGLPYSIDLGVMYSFVPDFDIQLIGGEIRGSILDGKGAMPAVALRASYSSLIGVTDYSLQTVGLDASIGKSFFILTPYVGGGALWVDSKLTGTLQSVSRLQEEKFWLGRFFAGLEIKPLPFFRILGEYEYCDRSLYTVKVAFGF